VTKALGELNGVLTTADLASMNQQVDSWRRLAQDVARTYLKDKGLLK
jgi:osmoprotectant transport system substrate-binding protein